MILKRYRITLEKSRNGVVIGERVVDVDSYNVPKVGESASYLTSPPIIETVIKVDEIKTT